MENSESLLEPFKMLSFILRCEFSFVSILNPGLKINRLTYMMFPSWLVGWKIEENKNNDLIKESVTTCIDRKNED